jgi:DNA-binding CsgD family transcriptional regulator
MKFPLGRTIIVEYSVALYAFREILLIASNSTDKKINEIYIANLDLLNLFIGHFKENMGQSKALSKAYDMTFDFHLSNESQEIDFNGHHLVRNRADFIESIQLNNYSDRLQIENIQLSKRQSEILRWVVRGKTFKEIARLLNLSPRTVGHYFEAIKNKLNLFTRSELIEKVMDAELINR